MGSPRLFLIMPSSADCWLQCLGFFLHVTSHLFQKIDKTFAQHWGEGVFWKAFQEGQIPMEKYLSNLLLYLLASSKKCLLLLLFLLFIFISSCYLISWHLINIWSHQITERNVRLLLWIIFLCYSLLLVHGNLNIAPPRFCPTTRPSQCVRRTWLK